MKLNYHLSRSSSLGSILLQRLLDAAGSLFLLLAAILFLFGSEIPSEMVSLLHWYAGPVLAAALIGAILLWKSHYLSRHLPVRLQVLIEAFKQGLKPEIRSLPMLTASTLLIWLLESGRFYCVCRSLNVEVGIPSAIIIPVAAAIATAIPLTPSGLGAVELVMVSLMTVLGFPAGPVKYTVIMLDRVVSYWSQIPIGLIALSISGFSETKIRTLKKNMKSITYEEAEP